MTTRYNYKWKAPEAISTPIRVEYELVTRIEPISYQDEDKKIVKEYKEVSEYVKHESLWSDFIKSYDLGSVQEQVMSHIEKGTPLITAHTLPDGDYTKASILKGAEIVREMQKKGVTLEMVESALNAQASEAVSSGDNEGE